MPTELPPLSQIGTGLRLPKIFAPLRRKSTHKPIAKQGSDELRPFLMPQAGSLHSIEIEGNSRNNTLNFRRRSDESRRSALTYPGIRQHLECGNTMRDRLNKELQYVKASQDRLEATQAKMLHVMKAMQKDQLESTENMTNIINDFSKRCAKVHKTNIDTGFHHAN
ncbi:unnamed protein product [Notodromas monacha]|uniref:Uncharacterized protein n=1 Tax=Notodromas monacha TaxID=399045 RepID=A0A7R9BJ26_9CRUS|nr:unnamed protein product [Notodromas monacha]CAG0915021.1 unnamed protein product [Notodromas monacha]